MARAMRGSGRAALAAALGLTASSVGGLSATAQVLPFGQPQPQTGYPPEPASAPGAAPGQATASPYTPAAPAAGASQPVVVQDATGTGTAPSAAAANPVPSAQDSRVVVVPAAAPAEHTHAAPAPGEVERYVATTLGKPVARFGASLMDLPDKTFATPSTTTIPPDYLLNSGDAIIVSLTGSIEGTTHLQIDNDGRVFLPRVGAINLAGVRYGDLMAVLSKRIGQQYRNFHVSVAIERLHGITVYVTGYAVTPGAYTLSSLSTLVNAVMASGGPNAGGSFRSIQLRRGGQVVTDFDFYDLLLRGDKTRDVTLQNQDVIFIAAVGPEAAITGSVNQEAIYEAKPGETLGDLLGYAGGLSSLSDMSRVFVDRLSNLDRKGWERLEMAATGTTPVERADILRVVSVADYARPLERQAIVVKIEGEVDHPGRYYLSPNSTMADLLAQAGGLTSHAFVFGTEFDRVTVRNQQKAGFDEAIQNLELSVAAAPLGTSPALSGDLGSQVARAQLAREVIEQLRTREPDGRVVLSLTPRSTQLPADFTLENDDRIYVPPSPTTVGVFGAVFRPGSFVFQSPRRIGDYLKMAGGPERIADRGEVFVVRANGAVVSDRELGWGSSIAGQPALPGDVIFVPIKTQPNLWWERLVQATSIFYNIGLGAAAIRVLAK
jgi:polysaccharide export outer membrane protein